VLHIFLKARRGEKEVSFQYEPVPESEEGMLLMSLPDQHLYRKEQFPLPFLSLNGIKKPT
jgi:hypothetical protein